ncbi:HAMP domain-containing sensor histidine kinase [uncultured Draconibacterium sp.]|uniref:sensor histidine kinase n=1 Tax=uncultured Draconibacterium sp. TaxID=1573823 RepID=UPI003261CB8E
MTKRNKIFNSLYWKVSGIFLAFTVLLTLIFILISVKFSADYNEEAQQKINGEIAIGAINEVTPIFVDGKVKKEAIHVLMHSAMAVHPSIEVYLLDPEGNIITYVVPTKDVKSDKVDLGPIKQFLNRSNDRIIRGDDPRNPGSPKIFSAAEIIEENQLKGYMYIVLASNQYTSVMASLQNSFILKLGVRSLLVALLLTSLLGLLAIWIITRNLNKIINAVRSFKEGNHSVRIQHNNKGELDNMAETFNTMAQTIEQNIIQLKSVEALRKELIANVSHDLRSPIASIQGFAETILLKDDNIADEERTKYLNIILQNSENLSKLVNDLFELSKLESNAQSIQPEPVQVAELVQDVADKFQLIAKEKNISINTIYSKSLPLVYADIQMTDRVFQNILDNAIKYCNANDVVTIELELQNDGILVKIADTGKGIAEDELPNIFTRYYKGKKTNGANSTGLGLAIVKKILDLHQSSIKVYSQLNKGTRFEFKLPLYQVA